MLFGAAGRGTKLVAPQVHARFLGAATSPCPTPPLAAAPQKLGRLKYMLNYWGRRPLEYVHRTALFDVKVTSQVRAWERGMEKAGTPVPARLVGDPCRPRFGFVSHKSVFGNKAVVRNRARRRLREGARKQVRLTPVPVHVDYIVVGKEACLECSFETLQEEFRRFCTAPRLEEIARRQNG